ncbi:radical SAM family heme chaperone HemW [Photorhabdus laumondii subsp. laumondii]|uniref:Heme chaperone HemW n=2 Tax=Photorhabdus laumondii subsp. laumondii TaxID=141679 RepID=Q7N7H3_PHOLL|nr:MULTISPECIES: radical SAM family heme chaperone HemW [Photorhabdus]AWK41066.1 YggW family oxidoreductase [Photorhabdus laumondii subsp. laumondii]AXG41806.1 YggW family oxidoreductase [Photorhabdus laumondii subsp. laumondii]AXG46394.1 YggW family oxidoreductase [Photorhabdus laumondii subsp. laumondii]KTL62422.1 coproporphyrinogen III oxidase [Photorhabdus laumondii subsp. laumondii]MCC8383117.1 radical SAM family heme chaperone HemW [Photorhabdus laumondii]
MLKLPPLSLYIHIPWCVQKCPYCDFNSHALKGDVPHQEYVDHLLADLKTDLPMVNGREVTTIFIGGGTPSLLSSQAMQQLLDGVRALLPVSPQAEITMEANPGTVEADRFSGYQQAGINRISIGVQSFSPDKLVRLGRIHGPDEAKRAAHLAASLGLRSFNLDLMHGLPNQSLDEALDDLRQAIELSPPHLSWYQLTIEPNTSFGSRPPVLPDDDALWDIFSQGHQLLTAAGYQQYETSAYAKPGYQCQHNLNYWRFGDYLGIGCGAHGKITFEDGRILRTVKTKHPRGYMQGRYLDKQHQVENEDRPFEFFMNRFRLLEAMPKQDFSDFTGLSETSIRTQIKQALAAGYLSETATHWQITQKGKLFLNSLLELFL